MCLQSASFLVDRPSTSFMWQKSSSTFVLGLHNVGNHPWGFQVHPYGHSHITLIFQNLILVHLTIAWACRLTARWVLFFFLQNPTFSCPHHHHSVPTFKMSGSMPPPLCQFHSYIKFSNSFGLCHKIKSARSGIKVSCLITVFSGSQT